MPTKGVGMSWSEVAKTQGVSWVLLVLIISMLGAGANRMFNEIPHHLDQIEKGYQRNAAQLEKTADKFVGSVLGVMKEYKADQRLNQQQLIELIRESELPGERVSNALERASEKSKAEADLRNLNGHEG